MSIQIGNYSFDGPFAASDSLRNNSGVYAVLTRRTETDRYTVIDIGESGGVKDRVANHDRAPQWSRKSLGRLGVSAYYCDERTRTRIESELRAIYSPVCGVR